VLANQTSWPFQISSNGRGKDTGTSTFDMAKTSMKQKQKQGLKFYKDRK